MANGRTLSRRHLIGVDEGPFDKFGGPREVTLVAVMMEGPDLVEAVATERFPVDGEEATQFLARWLGALRCRPALQGVLLGGVTLAGLGVVDLPALSAALSLPVLNVNRRRPGNDAVRKALETAGFAHRFGAVERAPEPREAAPGLWVGAAGLDPEEACAWVRAACGKAQIPEPLRLAHLIAAALATGESRGRP
jgi:endonuclease V-like protein UPF0215 family